MSKILSTFKRTHSGKFRDVVKAEQSGSHVLSSMSGVHPACEQRLLWGQLKKINRVLLSFSYSVTKALAEVRLKTTKIPKKSSRPCNPQSTLIHSHQYQAHVKGPGHLSL